MDKEKKLIEISTSKTSPYGEFTYISIWECEFDEALKQDPTLKAFVKEYSKFYRAAPLNPRNTFKGGKTETFKHHVVVDHEKGEKIKYLDFTSLYPSINAGVHGEEYPLGHPQIFLSKDIKEEFGEPEEAIRNGLIFGLVKCEVYPPHRLMHPVLGVSMNSKLMFSLCRKCAEDQSEVNCTHTDAMRKFTGEWVSIELREALRLGYRLGKVFEVWNWPESQRSKTLFKVSFQ